MPHERLRFGNGFRVVLGDEHSQAAPMTLAPGAAEGGPDTHHRGADRWMHVVDGEWIDLRGGTLVLIPRGDAHEIRNTGRVPLRTLNIDIPPAYTPGGEGRATGRP